MTTSPIARPKTQRTLKSFLPIVGWLPKYELSNIRPDIIAAITVWALLVPEAMAYAGIAGMPPATGLYAAPLALLGYAIFGSSRHLNVGPSSTVAIISFGVISTIAITGTEHFYALTSALAIVTGIIMLLGGLLHLGVLADFLSKPVLDGFIVGLAITIAVGQLDKILGYSVENPNFVPDLLALLVSVNQLQVWTFVVGAASLASLFLMEAYLPKVPAAIVVVMGAIAVSWLFDAVSFLPGFHDLGIHIVGALPGGRIPLGLPSGLTVNEITRLIPGAAAVAIVGFSESVAAARSYAATHGYDVDADQEMIALGIANAGAGFSGGFSVDGSLSKTAASVQAGANTQVVSIVAALMIIVTAWFLTGLFYFLPEATLGAIVIHAVWHLINYKSIWTYRKYTPIDFWTALIAVVGVLAFGILAGLLLAVGIALLFLLVSAKNRKTSILGKVTSSDGTGYRAIENYPNATTYPGLMILRFDGNVFFANAPEFSEEIIFSATEIQPSPNVILVDASEITSIDATTIMAISDLQKKLRLLDVDLWFANVRTNVREVMRTAGLEEKIGQERFFLSIQAGVDVFLSEPARSMDNAPTLDDTVEKHPPSDEHVILNQDEQND